MRAWGNNKVGPESKPPIQSSPKLSRFTSAPFESTRLGHGSTVGLATRSAGYGPGKAASRHADRGQPRMTAGVAARTRVGEGRRVSGCCVHRSHAGRATANKKGAQVNGNRTWATEV